MKVVLTSIICWSVGHFAVNRLKTRVWLQWTQINSCPKNRCYLEYMYDCTEKRLRRVAWNDKNTEKRRKYVCAIASVHKCDWLVLEKYKKITTK